MAVRPRVGVAVTVAGGAGQALFHFPAHKYQLHECRQVGHQKDDRGTGNEREYQQDHACRSTNAKGYVRSWVFVSHKSSPKVPGRCPLDPALARGPPPEHAGGQGESRCAGGHAAHYVRGGESTGQAADRPASLLKRRYQNPFATARPRAVGTASALSAPDDSQHAVIRMGNDEDHVCYRGSASGQGKRNAGCSPRPTRLCTYCCPEFDDASYQTGHPTPRERGRGISARLGAGSGGARSVDVHTARRVLRHLQHVDESIQGLARTLELPVRDAP